MLITQALCPEHVMQAVCPDCSLALQQAGDCTVSHRPAQAIEQAVRQAAVQERKTFDRLGAQRLCPQHVMGISLLHCSLSCSLPSLTECICICAGAGSAFKCSLVPLACNTA